MVNWVRSTLRQLAQIHIAVLRKLKEGKAPEQAKELTPLHTELDKNIANLESLIIKV